MIVVDKECAFRHTDWQTCFVTMLPELERRLRSSFRHLDPAARSEALAEGVAHCVRAYEALHRRQRTNVARPSTLAFYASRQVRSGRPAAGRLYRQELLPRYAQIGNDIHLEQRPGNWPDELVEDKRASVPDQVAAKLDVAAWFATLPGRMQHIAKQLACGFTTSEVAAQHRLPRGRVSQLRRELHDSWREFQAGAAPAMSFGDIHQWTPSAASRLRDVLQPGELFVVVRRHVAVR